MWDVIWTDPDRELVGEHRARKQRDGDQERKHRARSGRNSVSTASSRSSADSHFSIFRSRGLRRVNTSGSASGSTNAQMESSFSSGNESASILSARSPLSRTFDDSSHRSSLGRASTSIFERRINNTAGGPSNDSSPVQADKMKDCDGKLSLTLSNHDSIFSTTSAIGDLTISSSVNDDFMPDSEKVKSLIQIFGESSSIARQAELCLSPQINAACSPEGDESAGTKKPNSDSPLTPPVSPTKRKLDSPLALVPPIKSPLRLAAPSWHLPVMPNNPDAWKPPDQWDPIPFEPRTRISTSKSKPCLAMAPLSATPNNNDKSSGAWQDPEWLQADVLEMKSASATDMVMRLKEFWASTANRNLNFLLSNSDEIGEQRRWMLSTLSHLDSVPDATSRRRTHCQQSPITARMVLSLYESQATVTYLAALYPTKQLYHVTPSPTSYEQFRNIRTISVSSISPADFPVAPRLFESVHSLSLPSLCTTMMLPGILKNINKCLKTAGTLKLTLLDPLPRAGTMGVHMRGWIETHLLRNLARQHRCMSPSTLFPKLLGEAGLRGSTSTRTSTKFYAIPESAVSRRGADADGGEEALREESEAKAQVRSLVGRMLWVEVWGPYVTADKWWWEEPECVKECLELGTIWEYHTIMGVKGD